MGKIKKPVMRYSVLMEMPRLSRKMKHISIRKKIILLNLSEIKKHIRQKQERNKMRAISDAIATINFKRLKIIADPKVDINYVKGISTMSLYGHTYRNTVNENIFEDSVYIRPDVMNKLSNLDINDKNEESWNVNVLKHEKGFDIFQKIYYLHINDDNELDINDGIKNIVVSDNINNPEQF